MSLLFVSGVSSPAVGVSAVRPRRKKADDGLVRVGLVAEYRFDQRRGQVLVDWSGWGRHGRLGSASGSDTNDPTWEGDSLAFGADDYVALVNTGILRGVDLAFYTPSNITPASTGKALVGIGSFSGIALGPVAAALTNEILTVIVSTSEGNPDNYRIGWTQSDGQIAAGWHLAQFNWTGTTWEILLDGTLKSTSSDGTAAPLPANNTVRLGMFSTFNSDGLKMAYAMFYSETRTLDQIQANYQGIKAILAKRGMTIP